jgi:hypothetical protein
MLRRGAANGQRSDDDNRGEQATRTCTDDHDLSLTPRGCHPIGGPCVEPGSSERRPTLEGFGVAQRLRTLPKVVRAGCKAARRLSLTQWCGRADPCSLEATPGPPDFADLYSPRG